jgi:adenosylcobinamide-phosphate synthase
MIGLREASIVGLALLIDGIGGDPPNRFHPVAWMGTAIAWAKAKAPRRGNGRRFLYGLLLIIVGGTIVVGLGVLIERASLLTTNASQVVDNAAWWLALGIQAMTLKICFGARSLAAAARAVADALHQGDLAMARQQVAYHLVSRNVTELNAPELSAATIESVAENLSDSVVAPLFFFAVAGLPGAMLYRFVNTCDAMLGYRTAELEWLGKASARADDFLNLIPARLTAALVLFATLPSVEQFALGVRIWWRDAWLTASPNAGHPMSAAAGVLGVMLEKKHHYRLGEGLPLPDVCTIGRMLALFGRCVLLAALLAGAAVALKPYLLASLI